MREQVSTRYVVRPAVQWANDAGLVVVVDPESDQVHLLTGEAAAIWSWLTLSYRLQTLLPMVANLWSQPPDVALEQLRRLLDHWCGAGLLERVDG